MQHTPSLIGVIHFPPLPGFAGSPGLEEAAACALADLRAFEEGGADAVFIENNYDLPHLIEVEPTTVAAMTFLGGLLRTSTRLPMGVSVLWNDYRAAFAIAKTLELQFVRVPVLVDSVKTDFGTAEGDPSAVAAYREKIGAQHIKLFADVHVKHAVSLSKKTLGESVREAAAQGADGVIVTGKWTGDPPAEADLAAARQAAPNTPLLAGSGVDATNVSSVLRYADGVIVSTSLKFPDDARHERNVLPWRQRIDPARVAALSDAMRRLS